MAITSGLTLLQKLQKLFGIIPRIRKKHRKNKGDEDNQSLTDEDEKDDEGGTGTASADVDNRGGEFWSTGVDGNEAVVPVLA